MFSLPLSVKTIGRLPNQPSLTLPTSPNNTSFKHQSTSPIVSPTCKQSDNNPSRMNRLKQRIGEVFLAATQSTGIALPSLKLSKQPPVAVLESKHQVDGRFNEGELKRVVKNKRLRLANLQLASALDDRNQRESTAETSSFQQHRLFSSVISSVGRVSLPSIERLSNETPIKKHAFAQVTSSSSFNPEENPQNNQPEAFIDHSKLSTRRFSQESIQFESNRNSTVNLQKYQHYQQQKSLPDNQGSDCENDAQGQPIQPAYPIIVCQESQPRQQRKRNQEQHSLHSQSPPPFNIPQWRCKIQSTEFRSRPLHSQESTTSSPMRSPARAAAAVQQSRITDRQEEIIPSSSNNQLKLKTPSANTSNISSPKKRRIISLAALAQLSEGRTSREQMLSERKINVRPILRHANSQPAVAEVIYKSIDLNNILVSPFTTDKGGDTQPVLTSLTNISSEQNIPRIVIQDSAKTNTDSSLQHHTEQIILLNPSGGCYPIDSLIAPRKETKQVKVYVDKLCSYLESDMSSDEVIGKEIVRYKLTNESLAFYIKNYMNQIVQTGHNVCAFKISDGLFRRVRIVMEAKLRRLNVPEVFVGQIKGFISQLEQSFVSRNLFVQLGSEQIVNDLVKSVVDYVNQRTSIQIVMTVGSDKQILAAVSKFFCEMFKEEDVEKYLQQYDEMLLKKLHVTLTEFSLVKMFALEAMKAKHVAKEIKMKILETIEVIRNHMFQVYDEVKEQQMFTNKLIRELTNGGGYEEVMMKRLRVFKGQTDRETLAELVRAEVRCLLMQVDVMEMEKNVEKFLYRKEDFCYFISQFLKHLKTSIAMSLRPIDILNVEVNAMKAMIYLGLSQKNFGLFEDASEELKDCLIEEIQEIFYERGKQLEKRGMEWDKDTRESETRLLEKALNVNFICFAMDMIFNEFAVFNTEEMLVLKRFFLINNEVAGIQMRAFRNHFKKTNKTQSDKQVRQFLYFLHKAVVD